MPTLTLQSEKYGPYGSMSADGVQQLLGQPNLEPLEVLVRETVQNSWDARLPDTAPKYSIELRTLTETQADALRKVFAVLPPKESKSASEINGSLSKKELRVLEIADFNTKGLGGPTDPRSVPKQGEPADYVNFVRNLGAARDTKLGGGTYGYGKSALYRVSACRTVLIDSWSHYDNERRLVVCHLGHPYDVARKSAEGRYTGRHWWGGKEGAPLSKKAADDVARALNLPSRDQAQSGTTFLIIDPQIETEDSDGYTPGARIREALLWNFWPKMLAHRTGRFEMEFVVKEDGMDIDMLSPRDVPPLSMYAEALRRLDKGEDAIDIQCMRPKAHLGKLALHSAPRKARLAGSSERLMATSSHIALMRPARLVVKYLKVQTHMNDDHEWAGVFICDEEPSVEQAYADSEPPAHDDWVWSSLPHRSKARTYVKVGMQRIKEQVLEYFEKPIDPIDAEGDERFTSLSRSLGNMLSTVDGVGGGNPPPPGGGGGSRNTRPEVSLIGLEATEGAVEFRWGVTLPSSADSASRHAEATALFELKGGTAGELPGGLSPEVVGWYSKSGQLISEDARMSIDSKESQYEVVVRAAPGFAVQLKIAVKKEVT